MLFNSFAFLIFFPVVTFLFFIVPQHYRWLLLLLSSCVFYMAWIPAYILVLFGVILLDYTMARVMEPLEGPRRKLALAVSVLANCGILAFFKYGSFIEQNLCWLFSGVAQSTHWNFLLPIGLSFHTFQALSYTIEVYRGRQPAEKHLGIYALYVMFYPQLVAGPIERPQNLIHQFRQPMRASYEDITAGLQLMLWGYFKKVVIADRVAPFVNQVYDQPYLYDGLPLALAMYLFFFQIYCDFSGYSDIAIGAARVMGFRLTTNFKRPMLADSVAEFWHRWHISLSTWFRDYVYFPLGGSKTSPGRHFVNLILVFALSGLWHGASWTFLVWGLTFGTVYILYLMLKPLRSRLGLTKTVSGKILAVLMTFQVNCMVTVFFRARSIDDACYIYQHLSLPSRYDEPIFFSLFDLVLVCAAIGAMELAHILQEISESGTVPQLSFSCWPRWLRWASYYATMAAILLFGESASREFIYFQF